LRFPVQQRHAADLAQDSGHGKRRDSFENGMTYNYRWTENIQPYCGSLLDRGT
jgi:hypothetical protein